MSTAALLQLTTDLTREAALGDGTVGTFIEVLTSKITQWDKRYNKSNPYALGNYLGVVQKLRTELSSVLKNDDEPSLTKLKGVMNRKFDPKFPPVKATVKQIDAFLATGKKPSLVRRSADVEAMRRRAREVVAAKERLPKYGEAHREKVGDATIVVRGIFQNRKGDSYHVRVLRGEGKESDERKKGSVLWKDDFPYEGGDHKKVLKDAVKAAKDWLKSPAGKKKLEKKATSEKEAARDLGWWQEGDKKWYVQPKAGWDNEDIYFYPQKKQKNGGVSGLMKHDDGRGKSKKTSIDKMSLRMWKEVPESDVPPKVKSRIQERMASAITELTADLREATDKTAMSMGKEIFQSLVDIKKMYAARKAADEQTAQLLRDIMIKLSEELEPRNKGVQRAINRLNNAIGRPTTPDNLRNQIFKVADELGMRLPSAIF